MEGSVRHAFSSNAGTRIVCTWMYSTPPGDKVLHSQVGRDSDSQTTQNLYWRCAFCLFESSHRLNGSVRHLLFVNRPPPPWIDGIDIAKCMKAFNVELVDLGHWSRPPAEYYKEWNTQFIVLDILDWLSTRVSDDALVMVLDSDCFFNRPIGSDLEAAVCEHGTLLMSLDYALDFNINGLTRVALKSLSQEYDPGVDVSGGFIYSGGEFICATGQQVKQIAPRARSAYDNSMRRHAEGRPKFCEEAQLLSFVYHLLGYATHTGNRFIKRIWTDRSLHHNVNGQEDRLTIWHLPAEKKQGFIRVFRAIREDARGMRARVEDFGEVFGLREAPMRKVRRHLKSFVRPIYSLFTGRR
jgi:hypothetical protein